jgi:hypothetical protein
MHVFGFDLSMAANLSPSHARILHFLFSINGAYQYGHDTITFGLVNSTIWRASQAMCYCLPLLVDPSSLTRTSTVLTDLAMQIGTITMLNMLLSKA